MGLADGLAVNAGARQLTVDGDSLASQTEFASASNGTPIMQLVRLITVLAFAALGAAGAETRLRNGGFEDDPANGLPPGWQMWGHDAARDRRDFAVDEAVAHSGKRSLRILHPQGAKGYIVTAVRDNLIPVRSNRTYAISFYAKTSRSTPTSPFAAPRVSRAASPSTARPAIWGFPMTARASTA